ncbi:MAG: hypothetical protein KatS3mg109_0645 [Pirellulaceae bacterium]|nr:MAG: hypothetical protein KatS3mg109_0645 [Pirellulaceae bacterium]
MPGDPFRKVQAGQPLQIPAAVWNAMLDVVRAARNEQHTVDHATPTGITRPGIITVRNATGVAQDRFDVIGLDGPIVGPADNLREFESRVAFDAVVPTENHFGRFAILLEPLRAGAIGRAVIAGVTPARLYVDASLYAYARPRPGDTHALDSVPHGPARTVWSENVASSPRWAIIAFDEANYEEHVLITSNIPDEDGYYDGVVQRYDVASKTWYTIFACKVLDVNG